MSEIYVPAEDSYLLQDCIKKFLKKRKIKSALDMGSGSGIQTKTFLNFNIVPEHITLVDINKEAIKDLKSIFPRSKVIHSNLFAKVKGKFDLIVFNPPYLPEDKFDKNKDTSGGKIGNEIIIKFLKQAKNHITNKGSILLLVSSLTPKINFTSLGYKKKIIGRKKLFYEKLIVLELDIFPPKLYKYRRIL
ncbi:MAG: HemK2/MTQ2 family protein methyltransferase [Nanoarchaeota archaeon]